MRRSHLSRATSTPVPEAAHVGQRHARRLALAHLHEDLRGSSFLEYLILLGVIALVALVGFKFFGAGLYSKTRTQADHIATLTPTTGDSKSCFVAGTLVATPEGARPIEQVRVGDEVLSLDERTAQLAFKHVEKTFVTPDAALVEVRIREQSEAIRATPGHLFFTLDRGWIEAQALSPDEPLVDASGATLHVAHVARLAAREVVYNVEVEDTHTYFVGSARVWVHNPTADCNGDPIQYPFEIASSTDSDTPTCAGGSCPPGSGNCFVAGTPVLTSEGERPIEQIQKGDLVFSRDEITGEVSQRSVVQTYVRHAPSLVDVRVVNIDGLEDVIRATPEHRFWTLDRGWTEAGALAEREPLLDVQGRELALVSVKRLDFSATVYNFEVEGLHTYFVGAAAVWVHNPAPNYFPSGTNPQDYTSVNDNVGNNTNNCYYCSAAAMAGLSVNQLSNQEKIPVPPSTATPAEIGAFMGQTGLGTGAVITSTNVPAMVAQMQQEAQAYPNGTTFGIGFVRPNGTGHMVTGVVMNGQVQFVDFQTDPPTIANDISANSVSSITIFPPGPKAVNALQNPTFDQLRKYHHSVQQLK